VAPFVGLRHALAGAVLGADAGPQPPDGRRAARADARDRGPFAIAYAPVALPLFVLTNNPEAGAAVLPERAPRRGHEPSLGCEAVRCGPVFGAGLAPLGVRLDVRLRPALRLYGAGRRRRGALRPQRAGARGAAPQRDRRVGRRRGGARRPGVSVQAGYKYHHLSNAYTAARNPGVDGRVVYAGVLWRVGGAARGAEAAGAAHA
jgi:hypothetical protein